MPSTPRLASALLVGAGCGTWSPEPSVTPTPPEPVTAIAASPSGDRLAVILGGDVRVVSLPEGRPIAELPRQDPAPRRLAFSPDGRALATAAWNGTITVFGLHGHHAIATGEPRVPTAPPDDPEEPLHPGELGGGTCIDVAELGDRRACLREGERVELCDGREVCTAVAAAHLPPRPRRLLATRAGVIVAGDGPRVALVGADGAVRPVFVDGVVDRGAPR